VICPLRSEAPSAGGARKIGHRPDYVAVPPLDEVEAREAVDWCGSVSRMLGRGSGARIWT
jgi:hypothetical protein